MSAAWVAGSVRARAMASRRLGAAGARELARSGSLSDAVATLAKTPYGHDVRPEHDLGAAQHAVSACLLWHMRVIAGWLPVNHGIVIRTLAAGFEVANAEDRLSELAGGTTEAPFRLGGLRTASRRIDSATSAAELRAALAESAWGDPGSETAAGIGLGMRVAWAARVAALVPEARRWAAGAAALAVARAAVIGGTANNAALVRTATPLLGTQWASATSVPALALTLPRDARWPLDGVVGGEDLWRAEAAWWTRVGTDGFALLRSPGTTRAPVVGAVAVLAQDAWRVRGALEVAARAGQSAALEVFDGVA